MELTIFTYGHIDAMFYVLNGIAMLMNHGFTDGIIKTMCVVSTAYYGMKMAYAGASGGHRQYIGKIAAMILVINGLLLPKTEMIIRDHVSKKFDKVDNLPIGFAFPVGSIELFGDSLAGGFEQAFTSLKSANYRDYGMVFGARLIQEARNWRIKTPEFSENMHTYLRRCVIRDAMIGYRYTVNELLTTDNIWQLISENPNTLRKVAMRSKNSFELVSCKEAANNHIFSAFVPEIESLKKRNEHSDFANSTDVDKSVSRTASIINNMFAKNIELAFGSYLGSKQSAADLIKQQMMINALSDIGDEYGYARSSMQQESGWRIAGDLAATYLPILLSVIKGLLYASFIFMVPLMLLGGGMGKYLSYLKVIASLQLWPALNAILNMFIDIYSSNTLNDIANGIVSFATYSQVGNYADKIVAVASGLQMVAVPLLAFAIVQGGVAGFIHLANNITGAGQSAAMSVAGEVATGNRNLDNYSLGNMQVAMQSGFKTDWNQSYASGASSFQHMDGMMEKVLGNGQVLMQSGAGMTMSGGGVRYNLESSTQNQISQGLQTSESLLKSDMRAYSEAKSNTFAKTADFVSHIAQKELEGKAFNYEALGEQGKVLQQSVNHTRQYMESGKYNWEQAAQAGIKASLNAGLPFGIGGSIGVEGSLSATNSSNQSVGEDNLVNRDNNINDSYSNLVKAASNSSWAKENSIDISYTDSIRSSYETQNRLEDQVSKRQEEVDSWHLAKTRLDSNGGSQNKDMYHDVEQKLVKAYGVSTKEAHDMIENHDPRADRIWNGIIASEVSGLMQEVKAGRQKVSGQGAQQEFDEFSSRYEDKMSQNPGQEAQKAATNSGLDLEETKTSILSNKNTLQNQYQEMTNTNNVQYGAVKHHNQMEEHKINQMTEQYERDRIGRGKIGTAFGMLDGVGDPGKHVGKDYDHSVEEKVEYNRNGLSEKQKKQ